MRYTIGVAATQNFSCTSSASIAFAGHNDMTIIMILPFALRTLKEETKVKNYGENISNYNTFYLLITRRFNKLQKIFGHGFRHLTN